MPDDPVNAETGRFLVGSLLAIARGHITERVMQALQQQGFEDLRPAHMPVFMNLPPEGGRLTDLARAAQITKQSMGYLVEDLERGQYLRRDAHGTDARARWITRTKRGWRVNVIAKRAVAAVEREWLQLLGDRQMTEFKSALGRIAEHLGARYQGSVSEVSSRVSKPIRATTATQSRPPRPR